MAVALATTRVSANEVRRLVRAPEARVDRDLRIGAQRPRAVDDVVGLVRREDALRGDTSLDPLLQVGNRVESVGGIAATPARSHEQPEELTRLRQSLIATISPAAEKGHDVLVILDAPGCCMSRAAPEMGEENLAAAFLEGAQVRIDGVEQLREVRVGIIEVAVEIERSVIPVWIVVHHELEELISRAEDVRPSRVSAPTALAAAHQARIDLLAGSRLARPFVNLFQRVDLRCRQAGIGVLTDPAQKARRLKGAAKRIIEHAVDDAIERVAGRHGRVIDERERRPCKRYPPCRTSPGHSTHTARGCGSGRSWRS